MVEVCALEVDLRAAERIRPALAVIHRAGAADIVLEVIAELGDELRIVAKFFVGEPELFQRLDQGLGDKDAAIGTEVPMAVWQVMYFHS